MVHKSMMIWALKALSHPPRSQMHQPFISNRVIPTGISVPVSSTQETVVMIRKNRIYGVVYFRASEQEVNLTYRTFWF